MACHFFAILTFNSSPISPRECVVRTLRIYGVEEKRGCGGKENWGRRPKSGALPRSEGFENRNPSFHRFQKISHSGIGQSYHPSWDLSHFASSPL